MISSTRDQTDFTAKQEGSTSDNIGKQISRTSTTSTSSWSRLKDPRIVRVSRAFGGKDRHSKVCTVRGLRDRRVRLSVPTAIQLYDLQDRLGLNQPSKVVDWLLNAAKHEIDELPPLQMPPGNFGQCLQPMLTNSLLDSPHDKLEGLKMNSSLNWEDPLELSRSSYWNPDKSKEVTISRETKRLNQEEGKQDDGHDRQGNDHNGAFVSSSNFFSRANHSSSVPAGLLNNVVPNNSFLRWDPSNLSLSQFGSHGLSTPHQTEDIHSFNVVPLPNIPSGSHQLLVYPPQTQSYFPSHVSNASGEINFQMLSSSTSQNPLPISTTALTPPIYAISQGMRPFHLSMNPKFFPSQNNSENEPNKDA